MFPTLPAILLTLLVNSIDNQGFDPSKRDYCDYKCHEGFPNEEVHIACKCSILPEREEIFDELIPFREMALTLHNEIRNRVASGEALADTPQLKEASDMMALSYDMELEYYVRCNLGKWGTIPGYHDHCAHPSYARTNGQSIVMDEEREIDLPTNKDMMNKW